MSKHSDAQCLIGSSNRKSFASLVNAALEQRQDDTCDFVTTEEDSDEWLNANEQSFDQLVGFNDQIPPDCVSDNSMAASVVENQAANLKSLAGKVQGFVDAEGTLFGAKVEG